MDIQGVGGGMISQWRIGRIKLASSRGLSGAQISGYHMYEKSDSPILSDESDILSLANSFRPRLWSGIEISSDGAAVDDPGRRSLGGDVSESSSIKLSSIAWSCMTSR